MKADISALKAIRTLCLCDIVTLFSGVRVKGHISFVRVLLFYESFEVPSPKTDLTHSVPVFVLCKPYDMN